MAFMKFAICQSPEQYPSILTLAGHRRDATNDLTTSSHDDDDIFMTAFRLMSFSLDDLYELERKEPGSGYRLNGSSLGVIFFYFLG